MRDGMAIVSGGGGAAVPREGVGRAAEVAGAEGIVRGYASLFGVADMAGDAIEPGAFKASIARRGAAGIRMLWQHEPGRPIGIWTAVSEDRTGLLVEGRLALSTAGGREAFALIRAGAVDGLSIGFRTKRALKGVAGGAAKRRLVEIDLWEISIVTFPMQERARVIETRTSTDVRGSGLCGSGAEKLDGPGAGRIAAAVLGLTARHAAPRPAAARRGVG